MTNGKVTLRDVYGATADLEKKMDKRFDEIKKIVKDYGKRITAVELWRANMMGRVGVAVAILSLIFTMGWDYIKSKLIK